MILQLICQKCKKTEEVRTQIPPARGVFTKVTALLPEIHPTFDWEVWFCDDCWQEIEEMRETKSADEVEEFFRELFKPTKLDCE